MPANAERPRDDPRALAISFFTALPGAANTTKQTVPKSKEGILMITNTLIAASSNAESLSVLAVKINDQHDRAIGHATSALEHARQAGDLLQQAKQQVPHGEWLGWLSANCKVSARQAQRYLKVANNWKAITKYDAASYLTIDDAIATVGTKQGVTIAEAWTARVEALPIGMMLFGDFLHGYVLVFQSSDNPGFYHCYSYFMSPEFKGGEAQETRRPVRPFGISWMMNGDLNPDEFTEVEQGEYRENSPHIEGTLPYSRDFFRQIRGAK